MAITHTHTHYSNAGSLAVRRLAAALAITLAFVVIEALAGFYANSLALLTDAVHNLTDVIALALSWYALRLTARAAYSGRTYGYHRAGILIALVNSTTLAAISLGIFYEAYRRFLAPPTVEAGVLTVVATVAFLVNAGTAWLVRRGSENDLNLRSAFVHLAGDAISTFGAILAGLAIAFTGWQRLDPLVSVVIGLLILWNAWVIARESVDILLESTPRDVDMEAMVRDLRGAPGVRGLHDLHVWSITQNMRALSAHVLTDDISISTGAAIQSGLNELLAHKYHIAHATLRAPDPRTGEWNDSLAGDYLWTNSNFGEAVPDVMTPLTWSLLQIYIAAALPFPIPGGHPYMGNVGGRFYLNVSLGASFFAVLGMNRQRMNYEMEEFFGRIPEGFEIPTVPLPRWRVLRTVLPLVPRLLKRAADNRRRLPEFVAAFPARCEALRGRVRAAQARADLLNVWREGLGPLYGEACLMLAAGTSGYENAYRPLHHELRRLVGEEDANALLTGLSEGANRLASLGPLVGLAQAARGEMTSEAYAQQYGHRGPHEFEVSLPRPAEDLAWIDRQLASLGHADVEGLLAKQQAQREAVWARFIQRYPRKAKSMQKRLAGAAQAARGREAIRSEIVRGLWVIRKFALRAGELTGLGEDVFFLSIDELLAVLGGDDAAAAFIPARRETHARYSALPPYPALIRGRFDPFQWAADPNRRSDLFDARQDLRGFGNREGLIKGFPGAAGVVKGLVRVLAAPEQGHELQPGEILVTVTTNVGWTPLFPRAAAIVTDVGAPLSHAAIVARELGIPAVVGCGDATLRLKTGDRVRVNGGQGVVEIVQVKA